MLGGTPSYEWRIVLMHSFTACVLLLATTSTLSKINVNKVFVSDMLVMPYDA